jgi:hypothetical protein
VHASKHSCWCCCCCRCRCYCCCGCSCWKSGVSVSWYSCFSRRPLCHDLHALTRARIVSKWASTQHWHSLPA